MYVMMIIIKLFKNVYKISKWYRYCIIVPEIRNLDEGVQVYMQCYTKEIEEEYGVVGIHVKLL